MAENSDDARGQLTAARAGSREALGQLLETYRAYLTLVAQRELDPVLRVKGGASDIVQDTLLAAVQAFDHFQGNAEEDLRRWLRRLLLNNLVDHARRYRGARKRDARREAALETASPSGEHTFDPPASTPTPSRVLMAEEENDAIHRALERLPEDYRLVLLLRFQEDLSYEEIGKLMDLTPNAARKLWARAMKRLQEEMPEAS